MTIALSGGAGLLRALAMTMALLLVVGCKESVDMHTGLTDQEANRVITALRQDGIDAEKRTTKEGVTVSVAPSDLPRATQVLQASGLPHRASARMGDVFRKEGLISSPMEERARYVYALSQELEATLAEIDGVVIARVHVVLPEKVAPGEPLQPPSAAVFIKHLPGLDPDVITLRVRQLVARSIPGMGSQAVDRVSVIFVVADVLPRRLAPAPSYTGGWITLILVLVAALAGGAAFLVRAAKGRRDALLVNDADDASEGGEDGEAGGPWDAQGQDALADLPDTGRKGPAAPSQIKPAPLGA
ncbi:Secretory protein of YscJ/FliF family protein [Roseateles sp. YR242]|uniref:type III secretion system inner membrane ring lipoprotein SctJ n=1 Tax=Roseateles sp. YR242 TaxID=1855305 RepID=UPI0008D4ADCA|nr:type III secretion inner membrane ring lipoprotein SctJ [Roseateles sp. YR242]SEK63755.1 Secretory protein of YscJ/FliF family protein [Roseateles sp. YR242]